MRIFIMKSTLIYAIVIAILIVAFVYLVLWTIKICTNNVDKKRVVQEEKIKKKKEKMVKEAKVLAPEAKYYWYNLEDAANCESEIEKSALYNYFANANDCVMDLITEMYDCGLVRTEELTSLSYGVGLFEEEKSEEVAEDKEIPTVDFEEAEEDSDAGTEVLTSDMSAAEVDDIDNQAITYNSEDREERAINQKNALVDDKDAEVYKPDLDSDEYAGLTEADKARRVVIKTAIYDRWVGYVKDLYKIVELDAPEEIKLEINREMMHYGYNDIEVLLHSPE